jgi:hypothetical protein
VRLCACRRAGAGEEEEEVDRRPQKETKTDQELSSRHDHLLWYVCPSAKRTLPAPVHLFVCFVAFCCSRRLPLHLCIQRIVFVTFVTFCVNGFSPRTLTILPFVNPRYVEKGTKDLWTSRTPIWTCDQQSQPKSHLFREWARQPFPSSDCEWWFRAVIDKLFTFDRRTVVE